jgi:hypothetical protein
MNFCSDDDTSKEKRAKAINIFNAKECIIEFILFMRKKFISIKIFILLKFLKIIEIKMESLMYV